MRFPLRNVGVSLALAAVLTAAQAHAANISGYTDVPDTHAYASAVRFVRDWGVMPPGDDGLFHPDDTVTRSAFIRLLMDFVFKPEVISSCTRDLNGTSPFADVPNLDAVTYGKWDPLESTCRHASLSIL